jgi:hypothetical protein
MDDLELVAATDPGDAFEDTCWAVLRRKYRQQDLVYIPATMGGDYGIEGYSADGAVYQCYADRDSVTLRHRTDKQKAKLRTDTAKLKKNTKVLESTFDGMLVEHCIFMVPQYHAAELITYAAQVSKDVRGWGLPFISPRFAIRVKTLHDYPAELSAVLREGVAMALVGDVEVPESDVDDFPAKKPDLVQVLDDKLAVAATNSEEAALLRRRFVHAFLAKEQLMDALSDWPETWESVERQRRMHEAFLEMQSILATDEPKLRITSVIESYRDALSTNVASLGPEDAQWLSVGQAGEWLMRCPLRFSTS